MSPTILDVLDHFDGGNTVTSGRATRMSLEEIDELCEQVNSFYEAWTPPIQGANQDAPLTVYPGGMVGGITTEGSPELAHLFAALMYYPRAIIHDPLSSWFNRDKERLTLKSGPRLRGDEVWATSTELNT